MKKTAEETLNKYWKLHTEKSVKEVTEAMKEYAIEAIKADRERVAEKAKIAFHCGTTKITHSISHYQSGADNIRIDKQSILNLPIELP